MTARDVAERHVAAVRYHGPVEMAADYSDDAVLVRGDDVYRGRDAIEGYFRTVPQRLGGGRVEFDEVSVHENTAVLRWHITGGPHEGVAGFDTCEVRGDRIVSQRVHLQSSDF